MMYTTLCYLERGGEYLMLHRVKKAHDLNQGKWIGVGGKFQEGESPEDCILRECREETGLTLTEYRYRGLVTFVSNEAPTEYMHLFTASAWTGTPHSCDEGELAWIQKTELLSLPLWEGDKLFLRLLDTGAPFFSLKLRYEGDRLVQAALNGRNLPELELAPLTEDHLEGAAALWGDPQAIRYTAIPAPLDRAAAQARLERLEEIPTVFAVLQWGQFAGVAGCLPAEGEEGAYGLFYQLLPQVWGRGLGLAAARAALEALERQAPEALVYAETAAENAASVRILERLGFRRTGESGRVLKYARRPGGKEVEP